MRKLWRLFGRTGMLVITALVAVKFADKIKELLAGIPVVGNFFNDAA